MRKIIYIIIETVRRELDSKIILALKAKENNFDVAITKKSRLFGVLKYLKSGIIFLKSFGPRYNKILDNVKKNGHVLVGIDEEALQSTNDEWLVGSLRFSKYVYQDLKILFTWGSKSKNIYKKFLIKKKLNPSKIVVSGSPRIDILKEKYKKIFKINKETILPYKNKDYILVTTQFQNYHRTDNTFKGFDKSNFDKYLKKKYKGSRFSKGSHFKKEITEFARKFGFQKENFIKYDQMYEILCKKFPNEIFLVVPHPGEGLNYYYDLEKKFKNLKIVTDNSNLNKWILCSKLLISCNCTTTIEARILNIPNINYIPCKDALAEYELSKSSSINLRKIDDLIKFIHKKKYKKFKLPKDNQLKIKKHLANFSNNYSVDVIVKNLKLVEIDYKNFNNKYDNSFLFYYLFLKSKFHSFIGFFNRELFKNQLNKRKGLNLYDINKRLDEIQQVLYKKKKYRFTQKFYGIFKLEKV